MKRIKRIFYSTSVALTTALIIPATVLADWRPNKGTSYSSLDDVIRIGLNTSIVFAAVAAVAFLIYNGFKYMMASGDTGKVEEAQKGIANALIGLVVCLVAALLVSFVLGRLDASEETTVETALLLLSA